MTFRNAISQQIEQWHLLQKRGLLLFAASWAGSILCQVAILICGGASPIFTIVNCLLALSAYYGLYLFAKVFYAAWKKTPCPHCGKPLGYLLLDSSYSKWRFSVVWMANFPQNIKKCPYCQFDFDAENS